MNTELINSINPYVLKCGYIGLCGFENDTYFFTLFKKMTGTAPLTFREMQRFPYV